MTELKKLSGNLLSDYVKLLGTTQPIYFDYTFFICIYKIDKK